MKLRAIIVASLAPIAFLSGCDGILKLDNFDPPNAVLSGTITYNGQPVNIRAQGINLSLRQPHYELNGSVSVYANQVGFYRATIFSGDYIFHLPANQGPWLTPGVDADTLRFTVNKGDNAVDFPVTPYFTVGTPTYTYVPTTGVEGRVNATFSINTIVGSTHPNFRQLEWAALYVSTTGFVDRTNQAARIEQLRTGGNANAGTILASNWPTTPVTMGVNLPAGIRVRQDPTVRTEVFVRVGVKVTGIGEMIFSPVTKLSIAQ